MATGIRDVNRKQQQEHDPETRKRDTWIVPLPVIALHAIQKCDYGENGPTKLPQEKVGARDVELQFGHNRRRTVNHHQAETNQAHDGEKKQPIGFKTLCH